MNLDNIITLLTQEFSNQSLMDNLSHISQLHRIQGSTNFLEATHYIQSILNEAGIKNTLNEFPADGRSEIWGWIAPISWDIMSAELQLVKPIKKRLIRFKDFPMGVITHSKAADFEAAVIDAKKGDKGEDYEGAHGKVALITASPRQVFQLASQHGVKGLILHPNPQRALDIGGKAVQYDGFWPIENNLSDVSAGFSISQKQYLEIKQFLDEDKEVIVHFRVNANLKHGQLHVLEAVIEGSEYPLEEVIFIAHLCHPSPGANDNASGSASILELILSLNHLIQSQRIPAPKRTLRFLWVPEFSGTIPWLKQYYDNKEILAVLNLDMVGESPSIIGTPLQISSPSLSSPSFLDVLIEWIAEKVAAYPIKSNDG
jgi:hypothetical protein